LTSNKTIVQKQHTTESPPKEEPQTQCAPSTIKTRIAHNLQENKQGTKTATTTHILLPITINC
jgi:pyruvate/2-oxoglutarate dehydrogenase complex dihydrolipoamide acyltransferase (E2) component